MICTGYENRCFCGRCCDRANAEDAAKQKPIPMTCWGDGCEARIPDSSDEAMRAAGWGFMYARDDFSPTGMGAYFACPDHKSPTR